MDDLKRCFPIAINSIVRCNVDRVCISCHMDQNHEKLVSVLVFLEHKSPVFMLAILTARMLTGAMMQQCGRRVPGW